MKFGDVDLPVVQNIVRRKRRIFDTQRIVGASVGAKRDGGGFGREFAIQGVLTGADIEAKMLEIMALAGQARKLDLEDYAPPALCLMLTPRFVKQSEKPKRYFYELPFMQIESAKKGWLWDSAVISEILTGILRPELRTLTDSAIITEILAGFLRPEIRSLSDAPTINEILTWVGNYTAVLSDGAVISEILAGYLRPEIRTLQDSPVISEALSYETQLWALRELFDSVVITEILSGLLLPETRILSDAPIISELLNGFLRPEIRTLSDYPIISELLSGELIAHLQERWLYDYPVITEILTGMLYWKTPVNAYFTVGFFRKRSPSYNYATIPANFVQRRSPSYNYATVPANFIQGRSPSYNYSTIPIQKIRVIQPGTSA